MSGAGSDVRLAGFVPGVSKRVTFDQEALTFVAVAAAAETHDDGESSAFCLGAPGEMRIAGRQEFEIVETQATQARRPGRLHDEKVAGTGMTHYKEGQPTQEGKRQKEAVLF